MHLRIGGVPEHFNLPWLKAIENGRLDELGCTAEWIDFPGGTGAIMAALDDGSIDIATPLTEGAVTAIANGNTSRIVSIWVKSPLLWGVFAAGSSEVETVDELEGQRFAISRFGSGSDLMSRVLATQRGWNLSEDQFVPVGDLSGAVDALPAGEAEVFLWNKSMTQPHVEDGTFKRVDVLSTPWPAFAVAARRQLLLDDPELVRKVVGEAASQARFLAADDNLADHVVERYGIDHNDAQEWTEQVEWQRAYDPIDPRILPPIIDTMTAVGRIDQPVGPADIISPKLGRRTITGTVETTTMHRRYGGGDQFAEVTFRLEPNPDGGVVFDAVLDEEPFIWLSAIEHGALRALIRPDDDGDPIVDVRVTLLAYQDHPIDSSAMAFLIASRKCINEAVADPAASLIQLH